MTPAVAIVGGGPCGLTLARLLEVKGIDYVVYERDESSMVFSRGGGSLDIHPENGQRALREANLYEAFLKHARYDDEQFSLFDPHGKYWGEFGGEQEESSEPPKDGGRPEIDRLALRQILLDSIPKDKIQWGAGLKTASLDKDGKPVLEFANGSIESGFDLVVGTDGAWSKIRPLITQCKPQYSGEIYIETIVRPENPIFEYMKDKFGPGSAAILGGVTRMMIQRQGDRSYRIYYSMSVPEDYTQKTVDLSDAKSSSAALLSDEHFGSFAEEFKELIRHSDNFRAWPLYGLPLEAMGWKHVPGVTLCGDAAHVTRPSGEGVNVAMEDALVLANELAKHGTKEGRDEAVKAYEANMFVRGRETIKGSLDLEAIINHPGGAEAVMKISEEM